jgi:hypothetical protein
MNPRPNYSPWYEDERMFQDQRSHRCLSKIKTLSVCIFLYIGGSMHLEFVLEGMTINQTLYVEMLKRHIGAVRSMQGELCRVLILHHDNVPAHSLL